MQTMLQDRKGIICVVALVIIVGLFAGMKLSYGQDRPVEAGQSIVLTITADSIEDLYGYQFQLHYNHNDLEYTGSLNSSVDDINMIFSKSMEGGYELVGATMVGDQHGVYSENQPMCEMVFIAKKDGMLSDFSISLKKVNVVKSNMDYIEDIDGWNLQASVGSNS